MYLSLASSGAVARSDRHHFASRIMPCVHIYLWPALQVMEYAEEQTLSNCAPVSQLQVRRLHIRIRRTVVTRIHVNAINVLFALSCWSWYERWSCSETISMERSNTLTRALRQGLGAAAFHLRKNNNENSRSQRCTYKHTAFPTFQEPGAPHTPAHQACSLKPLQPGPRFRIYEYSSCSVVCFHAAAPLLQNMCHMQYNCHSFLSNGSHGHTETRDRTNFICGPADFYCIPGISRRVDQAPALHLLPGTTCTCAQVLLRLCICSKPALD